MILLRNASPYRASHTLAEAREPYKGTTGNPSRVNSPAVLLAKSKSVLKHVPKVDYLDHRNWRTKNVHDLVEGDIIFFNDKVYTFMSLEKLVPSRLAKHTRDTNLLTVLQDGMSKVLWMDAVLDYELLTLKGNNE